MTKEVSRLCSGLGVLSVRTTLYWLLVLADFACVGLASWLIFSDKNLLMGTALLVVSYFFSIVIQRMTRYLLKIHAVSKAIKKGNFREAETLLLEAAALAAKFKSTDPRLAELW